jgi:centriolar protein POC1
LDKTIAVYSLKEKNVRSLRFEIPFEINEIDWSQKNMIAAVGNSKLVNVCEAVMHKGYAERIVAHQSLINSVDFSLSSNKIITGGRDKVIKMFRLGSRNFISSFTGHTNWITSVRFSPNNKYIASCAEDKTMKLFDTVSGQLIETFKDEKGYGNQICWHPKDNQTIAIAQENGRVKIYDLKQRKLIQYYRIFDHAVKTLDFHPSGYHLITGDEGGSIKILDLLEGRDIYTIQGHQAAVTAAKFSKDGEYFVTGSKDKHLMIFKSNINPHPIFDDSVESSFEEMTSQKNNAHDKENQCDEKNGQTIDMRASVNYNYLGNDEINV